MGIDFAELRRKMVDNQLRTVDVTKLSVLAAFLTIPREKFVPEKLKDLSYLDVDIAFSVSSEGGDTRYMMEPAPLAKLLQAADVKKSDIVLDIGVTTGYAAALLSELASSVIALESDENLAEQATKLLADGSYDNVAVVTGALAEGYAGEGPYDVIIIEGAVDFIPEKLFSQLKEEGRLIVVEGHGNSGVARIYLKEDGLISTRRICNLAIKPLAAFLKKPEFEF